MTRITIALIIVLATVAAVGAQTKRRTRTDPKKSPVVEPSPTPIPDTPEPHVIKPEPKKNERPASNGNATPTAQAAELTYFYEFSQPDFDVSKITIQHDDSGKGTITFKKKVFDVAETDPIEVSPAALERINAALTALNFLDSTESYQYEKDYSHLGVMTFRLKRDSKERRTTFNYTVNKDAKVLADEYRKLTNQFVWIFDITVARQIQALDAPRLLDALDSLMKRNEISDPQQMLPLLRELTTDERLPLIARNHADRLVKQIEKGKK